jgi:hypothetical protein
VSSATPVTHRLGNLSVLGKVGAGQTIVSGFVLNGSKTILARAIGPTLANFGLSGVQAAPTLTLYDGSGLAVMSNSTWAGDTALSAAFGRVGAFPLDAASHDAAFALTIPAGSYTLQVTGDGNSGWALAELYDLDPIGSPANGKMINMSSLGRVAGSSTTLVMGFVVGGNSPRTVLIRGIGPGLAPFGVTDALSAPQLYLYDNAQKVIARNETWGTPVAIVPLASSHDVYPVPASPAEVTAGAASAGAFPLPAGSKDSCLLVTLAPGAYSAHVSGVNNANGTALIEIYELP